MKRATGQPVQNIRANLVLFGQSQSKPPVAGPLSRPRKKGQEIEHLGVCVLFRVLSVELFNLDVKI